MTHVMDALTIFIDMMCKDIGVHSDTMNDFFHST